jgi:hypothetical protein
LETITTLRQGLNLTHSHPSSNFIGASINGEK